MPVLTFHRLSYKLPAAIWLYVKGWLRMVLATSLRSECICWKYRRSIESYLLSAVGIPIVSESQDLGLRYLYFRDPTRLQIVRYINIFMQKIVC